MRHNCHLYSHLRDFSLLQLGDILILGLYNEQDFKVFPKSFFLRPMVAEQDLELHPRFLPLLNVNKNTILS